MSYTFRPTLRAWIEMIGLVALFGGLGLAALWSDKDGGGIVLVFGVALCLLLWGLRLARTWVQLDERSLSFRLGRRVQAVPWAEVLAAELAQKAQGKQRYWVLLLGTAQEVYWIPLQPFDRDTLWRLVQDRVPPAALAPEAYKQLPDYQEWLADSANLVAGTDASSRVSSLSPGLRWALVVGGVGFLTLLAFVLVRQQPTGDVFGRMFVPLVCLVPTCVHLHPPGAHNGPPGNGRCRRDLPHTTGSLPHPLGRGARGRDGPWRLCARSSRRRQAAGHDRPCLVGREGQGAARGAAERPNRSTWHRGSP